MDRFHLHVHALILALGLGLSALIPACADESIEIPERLRGAPTCAWVIDSWGHFEDGSVRMILDEPRSINGAACLCLTTDQYETKARFDELNDMALEVCEQLAAQHDFAWDECREDYESGRWLEFVFRGERNHNRAEAEALGCIGE